MLPLVAVAAGAAFGAIRALHSQHSGIPQSEPEAGPMSADFRPLDKGCRVWIQDADGGWQGGTVVGVEGPTAPVQVALDQPESAGEGASIVVAALPDTVVRANPALLDGEADLTRLTHLNEPALLHALRQRYGADIIYTFAGPVLVAINPFKPLGIYGPKAAAQFKTRRAAAAPGDAPTPHLFLTADKAFKQMVEHSQSQSILITGESGAGKTESTKIVMKYLAGLAGGSGMEDRVLETNPILEAFGNAKTIHNNNSSRFGKLIEIYFNKGHRICGAMISTYLLEKSRVAHQLPQERSYHIFYQLCRGASAAERKAYLLPRGGLETFCYLSQSGCTSIAGVDDAAAFGAVKAAMAAVGIGEERQRSTFGVLAAILWLGNVQFAAVSDDEVAVDKGSAEALRNAAKLLQVPEQALQTALTQRIMVAGGERITRQLSLQAAADSRDALSKAIYAALFKWLVDQINVALAVGGGNAEAATTLGILDIYGFECFRQNSFEQLCINYANERLQQQFNRHLFKLEQAQYEEEGIDWAHIEFIDNQECVDIIEARPPQAVGILSLLDEECLFPKGSDSTFAFKLRQQLAGRPRVSFNPKVHTDDFTVEHYAGPVNYDCQRFLDKNRDTLGEDVVAVLQCSKEGLVQLLAGEMLPRQDKKGSQTVGARFRDQLRDLMQRLESTSLHFIRCIKPNTQQAAGVFEPELVLHQLRCAGVLEVTRIARAGYPTRHLHEHFVERYRVLLPELACQGPLPRGMDMLGACRRLLRHFKVDEAQYRIGHTKLFFRASVLGQMEDACTRMQRSATLIQTTWRMARAQRAFQRQRSAAITTQAAWRGRQARLGFAGMLRRHRAAVRLQAAMRMHAQRQQYLRVLGERRAAELAAAEAERRAVEEAARQEQESFESIKRDFCMDAPQIRRVLALWQSQGDRLMHWLEDPENIEKSPKAAAALGVSGQHSSSQDSESLLAFAAQAAEAETRLAAALKEAEDLREENQLLHRAVATLRDAASTDPTAANHCQRVLDSLTSPSKRQTPGGRMVVDLLADARGVHPSGTIASPRGQGSAPDALRSRRATTSSGGEAASEDTISLMSGGTDSEVSGGEAVAVHQRRPSSGNTPVVGVEPLAAELERKIALLNDDADFIREVHTGMVDAPGMDAEAEFGRLLQRFKSWQDDFKERVYQTERALKHVPSATPKQGTTPVGPAAATPSRALGATSSAGLASRLFGKGSTRGGREAA